MVPYPERAFMASYAKIVLSLAGSFAFPCAAQTGTVTFYSYATTAKEQLATVGLPAGGKLSFVGWVYDGTKKIAHLSRGQFMTLRVPAGEHDFEISLHSEKPGKTSLHLAIESDKHYCARLSAKNLSPIVLWIGVVDLKIEQVACSAAFQEAGSYKRIDPKRVEPAVRADLDLSSSFPQEN